MSFPGGESVEDAPWDFRGLFESYIGGYPVTGKTLLDVGTASGFLAFSAEGAGAAHVTAVDAVDTSGFVRIPFRDGLYTKDRLRWISYAEINLKQLKNIFWYAWHKKGSSVEVVYTSASDLWKWDRKFDLVIAGAIVEHLSDPVPFISSLAGLATKAVIIAFTDVLDSDDQFMKTANAWDIQEFDYTWWILSRGLYKRIFSNLGFVCELTVTTANCNMFDPPITVHRPTIIAKRQIE
jgi:SAM-dependent methyltransferase